MRRRTSPRRSLVAVAMKAPLSCLPIHGKRGRRRCQTAAVGRAAAATRRDAALRPVQAGATAAAVTARASPRSASPAARGRGRVFGQREEEALARPVPARPLRPLEDVPVQLRGGLGVAGRGEDAAELDARMGGGPVRTRSLGGCEGAPLELFGVAHVSAREGA